VLLTTSTFPQIHATTLPTPTFTLQERVTLKIGLPVWVIHRTATETSKTQQEPPQKWIMGLK
jgi:hypothetical protein